MITLLVKVFSQSKFIEKTNMHKLCSKSVPKAVAVESILVAILDSL